jgi:hypothetical protein
MLDIKPIINGEGFRLLLDCVAPALTPDLENQIETLWQAEQKKRSKAMFNGRIMSAVNISENEIHGCIVEYRYLIAQCAKPELFDTLKLRPVAVSGLFECAEGIVFGRRAEGMTHGAGLWELVPSGGIDTSRVSDATEVNYLSQILTELHEETGVNADCVSSMGPFCLVVDVNSHLIDIGIALKSSLSGDEVLRLHREAAKEYDELKIVHNSDVDGFIGAEMSKIVDVSTALLRNRPGKIRTGSANTP